MADLADAQTHEYTSSSVIFQFLSLTISVPVTCVCLTTGPSRWDEISAPEKAENHFQQAG